MATQRVTMKETDKMVRDHLLYILRGDGAHVDFETAVNGVPPELRGKRPQGAQHSAWELLEHLRITQEDVLQSLRDPSYVSPEFPAGYWPRNVAPTDFEAWDRSINHFREDFNALIGLVDDPERDVFAAITGAEDQTLARKFLMLADHNSYHLGQLVLVRRLLGAWQ